MGRWLPHLIGLLTPIATIAGVLAGGWWMGATIYLALGLYPLLDLIAGKSSRNRPARRRQSVQLHSACPWNLGSSCGNGIALHRLS